MRKFFKTFNDTEKKTKFQLMILSFWRFYMVNNKST